MGQIWHRVLIMKQTILVTGGAGYIGSHVSLYLHQQGYNVVIVDNFWQGHQRTYPWAQVIKADVADEFVISRLLKDYSIKAVMHFAAFIEVSESIKRPADYYENNVIKTIQFLDLLRKHAVNTIVFSSSCAVYGLPDAVPIKETAALKPMSPYGKTKLIVEQILQDYDNAYGVKSVCLRYFNAAGAMPDFNMGERHVPESHIIPLLFKAYQEQKPFKIFGNTYPTPDGSCIRDFLHVWDIASAHHKALQFLEGHNQSDIFNLGTGIGYSVKEVVAAFEQLIGESINVTIEQPRAGDPAMLIADATKAYTLLNWQPHCSSLQAVLQSAWTFELMVNKYQEVSSIAKENY